MSRSLKILVVTLPLLACGVPEQKYKAALAETEKAVKDGDGQKQRADACEQKLKEEGARAGAAEKRAGELSERLAALEKAASSASADAAQQRELAAQLAKTRETLEGEKAAAAAEAERQRQLAARFEQEKTAASLDADQQRKLAAKLGEESSAAKIEAERQRLRALDLEKRSAEYEALASSLDKEIKAGQIQVSELKGKLTVRMAERVLFPSGSATVSAAGKKTLAAIGDAMKGVKGRIIRVEGHTDDVPIRSAKFPSNWELSSARAIAVVRILQERGVDPTLLGAAGYAEYQPIAPNDSAEGRAQNRRIEISLAAPLGERATAPGAR